MRIYPKSLLGAGMIGLLVLFGANRLKEGVIQEDFRNQLSVAEKRLVQVADAISQAINLRLNLTASLAAFVAVKRDFTQQEFDIFAARLEQNMGGIRSLQLAPDGIVTYLTNPENNRVALGHNLFTDNRVRDVIQESIREKKIIIQGPYQLRQGGIAIVARRPVFFSNPGEQDDDFWGFATVIVETDTILRDAGFLELENDYILAIRGKDGLGARGDTFHGDASTFDTPLAVSDVILPNASWQISAKRKPGQTQQGILHSPNFRWITVLLTGLCMAAAYLILSRPQHLRQKIHLATENLRTTLDSIGDAVIATDTTGKITLMNPVAEKLTGWDYESASGRDLESIFRIVHAQTNAPVTNPVDKAIESGQLVGPANHSLLKARNNKQYQIADSAAPIRDASGKITGVVLVFRDITREHAAQSALRESELRYRNLFENADVSIWHEDLTQVHRWIEGLRRDHVTDLRAHLKSNPQLAWEVADKVRVVNVNAATLKMFNAETEADFLYRIKDTFGPDAIEVFTDFLCAIWEGKRVFRKEAAYLTMDGKALKGIVSCRIPETAEEFANIPVSILDITDREQAEKALRRSQKMDAIGQLSGGIAHDFNNILSIILGNISLLQPLVSHNDRAAKQVENIRKSTQRAADLTKQLLGVSRRQPARVSTTNINRVIGGMENLIARSITPAVSVEHNFAADLWQTEIDSGDFEDAVLNFVLNARDAMPGGGCLTLETHNCTLDRHYCAKNPDMMPGEYVQLVVSDDGKGVPQEIQERIFEPFFTTKPPGKGTGLGLALVFAFASRSKGYVKVYSEMGIGTTFRLYLPRAHDQIQPLDLSETKFGAPPQGNETLLIVDDEPDLLKLAQESLESLGYRVLTASDAKQALTQLAEAHGIALIFSDVVMPGGMNGYELAERAIEMSPGIRVLLTSGYSEKAVTRNSQKRFNTNLLSKPYSLVELAHRVRVLLNSA